MLKQSKEASRHVEAVLSALDILDCFQEEQALTFKEIIDKTGLTRSRAMRLIGTMEARGYIIGNPETKNYHPGIKLSILGKSFDQNNHIEVLIRPVLKKLAKDIGESATFYVREGMDRVALAREEGSHTIRYVIREGRRHKLERGGAASKVLLAFGSPEILDAVLESFESDDSKVFLHDIEKVRAQGSAVSLAENTPGAHSISAPVFRGNRKLAGALTISGPSIRMEEAQIKKWRPILHETAAFLSERLGEFL